MKRPQFSPAGPCLYPWPRQARARQSLRSAVKQQLQQMSSAPVLSFLHLPIPPPFLSSHSSLCLPSKQEQPWTCFLKQQPRRSPPAVARIRAAPPPRLRPLPAGVTLPCAPQPRRVAPLLRPRRERQVALTSLERCGRSRALTARGPPLASPRPSAHLCLPFIRPPSPSNGPRPTG